MSAQDAITGGVSLRDSVVRAPEFVAAKIDEVTALMSLDESLYHLLDEGGSLIWERIASPIRIRDLCDALVAEFDVTAEQCEADVIEFLDKLLDRKVIQVRQES